MAQYLEDFRKRIPVASTFLSSKFFNAIADDSIAKVAPPTTHPYYPRSLTLYSGYVPNSYTTVQLLLIFFVAAGGIVATSIWAARRRRPNIEPVELATVAWFALCGCIHLFFEGYYSFNMSSNSRSSSLFAQLWKEYALADSRYLTQDAFVACMEAITAVFWGPLSLALTYMITVNHPLRYPIQIIVSQGQLYGDVLYFATSIFERVVHDKEFCRPEAQYFWFYYVVLNTPWIVIPILLTYTASVQCSKALALVTHADGSLAQSKKELSSPVGQSNGKPKTSRSKRSVS